jgi:hypothetical protein
MSTVQAILSEIDEGDTLSIDPDVGMPYRATVEQVHAECVTVRYQGGRPEHPDRRQVTATELASWKVAGRLIINPPARRGPSRRRA